MKIITLAAQKGGCGKSSLAISCAVLAAQQAQRALLFDLDPQQTLATWKRTRELPAPEVRKSADGPLEEELQELARAPFDFIFIDTPGHDNFLVGAAIRHASFTLIPCRPAVADIAAVVATARLASALKRPFAFVLEHVQPRGTRAEEAAAELAIVGEVAPVRIRQRMAWQDAFADGQGVSEYEPKGAAARELAALWRWLNTRINQGGLHAETATNQVSG